MEHMQDNGFRIVEEDYQKIQQIRSDYVVPANLQGCHTAIVDGYIIEGHVPADEVVRLLAEKPDITGLAVPGMPVGSPGMEVASGDVQPYDVIAFDKSGAENVYASYPK